MPKSISFSEQTYPCIKWGHVEGPMMVTSQGTCEFLSMWQRFKLWSGITTVLDVEKEFLNARKRRF
jgi:hypothetical protein